MLDYVFGNNAIYDSVSISPGTVIGTYGCGFGLQEGGSLAVAGTPNSPCWIVHCSTTQEYPCGTPCSDDAAVGGFVAGLDARFTRWSIAGGCPDHLRARDACYDSVAVLQSCEFYGGRISCACDQLWLGLANCLLDRVCLDLEGAPAVALQNCALLGGSLTLARYDWVPWSIKDTAFEGTTFSVDDPLNGDSAYTVFDHNAYLSGRASCRIRPAP